MVKDIAIKFSDDANEEISMLYEELKLLPLVEALKHNKVTPALKKSIESLLQILSDVFSTSIPSIDNDPQVTLRQVSRDINLSRLLRERGIFRLYRLVNNRVDIEVEGQGTANVPVFMTLTNPNTGGKFSTQEEFIGWFCQEAHVARGLIFMRIATIDRTMKLGFNLQDAFNLIAKKPYAIRETLNLVADWQKGGELEHIDPDIAIQIASRVSPDAKEEITALAEAARSEHPQDVSNLNEAMKPVMAELLQEVANHDRAGDALDFVRYDVLGQPEIEYGWNMELDALEVTFIQKGLDQETGTEYVVNAVKIPFIPDVLDLPEAVKEDLIRRLPIKNRFYLDNK